MQLPAHLLTVWPPPLRLGFLLYKMGMMIKIVATSTGQEGIKWLMCAVCGMELVRRLRADEYQRSVHRRAPFWGHLGGWIKPLCEGAELHLVSSKKEEFPIKCTGNEAEHGMGCSASQHGDCNIGQHTGSTMLGHLAAVTTEYIVHWPPVSSWGHDLTLSVVWCLQTPKGFWKRILVQWVKMSLGSQRSYLASDHAGSCQPINQLPVGQVSILIGTRRSGGGGPGVSFPE